MNNAQLGCHLENGWSQNSRSKNIERKEKNELFVFATHQKFVELFIVIFLPLFQLRQKKLSLKLNRLVGIVNRFLFPCL